MLCVSCQVSKKVQKVLGAPSKQWGCECRLALSVEDFAIKNGVNNRVSIFPVTDHSLQSGLFNVGSTCAVNYRKCSSIR